MARTIAEWPTILFATLVGCSDVTYVRTNPYDLEGDPVLEIVGVPDTTFIVGETFKPQVISDAPIPGGRYELSGPISGSLLGIFVTKAVKIEPQQATIEIWYGDRHISKSFIAMQRPVKLRLQCRFNTVCDTIRSLGIINQYEVGALDASNALVEDIPGLVEGLDIQSRDSGIAEVEDLGTIANRVVWSRSNGSTWLVATRGELRDSVRIVVRQRLASWQPSCPEEVHVGETVQLGYTHATDGRGNPMEIVEDPVWSGVSNDGSGEAIITPSGQFTGIAPGWWSVTSTGSGGDTRECSIIIVP